MPVLYGRKHRKQRSRFTEFTAKHIADLNIFPRLNSNSVNYGRSQEWYWNVIFIALVLFIYIVLEIYKMDKINAKINYRKYIGLVYYYCFNGIHLPRANFSFVNFQTSNGLKIYNILFSCNFILNNCHNIVLPFIQFIII